MLSSLQSPLPPAPPMWLLPPLPSVLVSLGVTVPRVRDKIYEGPRREPGLSWACVSSKYRITWIGSSPWSRLVTENESLVPGNTAGGESTLRIFFESISCLMCIKKTCPQIRVRSQHRA